MKDEKIATKTKGHTIYKTASGERVPSVTTVLGILNKPALLDWAWKCGLDGIDYHAVRDNAAGIGTLAHYLILCDIQNVKPDTSEYSVADLNKAETCLANTSISLPPTRIFWPKRGTVLIRLWCSGLVVKNQRALKSGTSATLRNTSRSSSIAWPFTSYNRN